MAEVALKAGDGGGYVDLDILAVFTRLRIRCAHAMHICHVRIAQRAGSGLILATQTARDWFEATHEFRFDRVSRREVRRVRLADGGGEIISDVPNDSGEYIDVELFIALRTRVSDHYLFGAPGRESWYGGRKDLSHATLDRVWEAIETKTPELESDHTAWPWRTRDGEAHVFVVIKDVDETEAQRLVSPLLELSDPDNPIQLSKRAHLIDWRNDLGMSEATIESIDDKTRRVERRFDLVRDHAPLVRNK